MRKPEDGCLVFFGQTDRCRLPVVITINGVGSRAILHVCSRSVGGVVISALSGD